MKIYSSNLHSQVVTARELKFLQKLHLLPPVMCQVSDVTCHMSDVTCHLSYVTCHTYIYFLIVRGGSVIDGVYPVVYFLGDKKVISNLIKTVNTEIWFWKCKFNRPARCSLGCSLNSFVIHEFINSLIESSFCSESSRHCLSQNHRSWRTSRKHVSVAAPLNYLIQLRLLNSHIII